MTLVAGVMALPLVGENPSARAVAVLAPGPVTVSGNQLLRNGQPWVPRGFVMVGVLSPDRTGAGGRAFQHLNDGAMKAALRWGADSLRFQVSQRGLDPQDSLYGGSQYLDDIRTAVDLASRHGLSVILSMQDQSLSGGTAHPQPSSATTRAWGTLTAAFNHRPDIMYELFNEPQNNDGPGGWAVWRDGGPAEDNQGDPAIGHQPLLDFVRATGSKNVLIVEGAKKGGSLIGIPLLHDPLGQLAYGVHPYLANAASDAAEWEARFGYLTPTVPVIATEWNAHSTSGICRPDWPQLAGGLLTYLAARGIGLYGWAFDMPSSLVRDWSRQPTSFADYDCGTRGGGAGELVLAHFQGAEYPEIPDTAGIPGTTAGRPRPSRVSSPCRPIPRGGGARCPRSCPAHGRAARSCRPGG